MTDSDPSDDDKVTLPEMGPYDAVEVPNVWPNKRCVPIEVLEELVDTWKGIGQNTPENDDIGGTYEFCADELQEIIENHE